MRTTLATLGVLAIALVPGASAQGMDSTHHMMHDAVHGMHHDGDSAFAAMQARGKVAMGVDQYTSQHRFDDLPDGGRIVLERTVDDSAGVAQIRHHMREIAREFQEGDFERPFMVHDTAVPGTAVMQAKRAAISYAAKDTPRGGEVRITSRDAEAVHAIHEFLAFQRREHRVGH